MQWVFFCLVWFDFAALGMESRALCVASALPYTQPVALLPYICGLAGSCISVQLHCRDDSKPVGAGPVLFQEAQRSLILPQFVFIPDSISHFREGPVILMRAPKTLDWLLTHLGHL